MQTIQVLTSDDHFTVCRLFICCQNNSLKIPNI